MAQPDAFETSLTDRPLPELEHSVYLARRAQGGDAEALNDLLARYQDRVERIVRIRLGARLRRHVETEDIVQEAFVVAARKIGDLEVRSHSGILQWLAKIAERQIHDAYDYHFAKKRDKDREKPLAQRSGPDTSSMSLQLSAADTAPSERAFKLEVREIMDGAMTELPEDYREVILLRDYSDADWSSIAQELGRPSEHACHELHRRARIRLRRLVAEKLGP